MSEEDHAKVLEALQQIEAAQKLLLRAAETLFSVPGFHDQWSDVCLFHGHTKQLWHKVDRQRVAIARRGRKEAVR